MCHDASTVGLITSLIGTAGSTYENINADQYRNTLQKNALNTQNRLRAATAPGAISAGTTALAQPLSQDMKSNIERDVASNLAERGLLGSTGIFQDVLASALAPYYQSNLQSAQNAYLAGLGIPQGVNMPPPQSTTSGGGAYSALSAALQKALSGESSGLVPSSLPSPDDTYYSSAVDIPPAITGDTGLSAMGQ